VNLRIAIIRTLAGYLVAAALALPIAPAIEKALGIGSVEARTQLTAGAVLAIGTVYYTGVRWLERRWPALGRLLGVPSPPSYLLTPADQAHPSAAELALLAGAELVAAEATHSAP
jgi:hypothetical protein